MMQRDQAEVAACIMPTPAAPSARVQSDTCPRPVWESLRRLMAWLGALVTEVIRVDQEEAEQEIWFPVVMLVALALVFAGMLMMVTVLAA